MHITRLRDRGNRVEVDLDGGRWRTLPVEVVVRAGLGVGRELDRPLARTLARELRRSRALHTAGRVLRVRDQSVQRLEQRLEQRAVPLAARAEAVATLQQAGILDDGRFASDRAQLLAGRGHSDAWIRAQLEQAGVAAELVEAAVQGLDPELERAQKVVERRGSGIATARYLASRGFDGEAIEAVVDDLIAGDG